MFYGQVKRFWLQWYYPRVKISRRGRKNRQRGQHFGLSIRWSRVRVPRWALAGYVLGSQPKSNWSPPVIWGS